MDPFIGEIRPAPYNFAPRGWALCQGQILPIAQNTALFSLLGVTFGGNGTTTFALPDLRGRVPVGAGTGVDQAYTLGEVAGEPNVTLAIANLPSHNHGTLVGTGADTQTPVDAVPGTSTFSVYSPQQNGTFSPAAVTEAGQSAPHNNMQPYLTINFMIALEGVFPQRS